MHTVNLVRSRSRYVALCAGNHVPVTYKASVDRLSTNRHTIFNMGKKNAFLAPSPMTSRIDGRRLAGAAAGILAVLFLFSSVAACDSSSSAGCQPATSFLWGGPSAEAQADTLILAAAKKLEPKKRVFNCSKQRSPQWQRLKPYRGEVRSNGKTGKRARYYEWDATHNDIEVYGPASKYKHLGSMDPITGRIYKDPVEGRNLRGKLK